MVSCKDGESPTRPTNRPNILFIAVDDLRPELGCYGKEYVHSPNIDRLASESMLFLNHYVVVPTCGASRYGIMTGQLPVSTSFLGNDIGVAQWSNRTEGEQPESFVHQLRRNGYYTVGIGKLSHYPDGYVYGYMDSISDTREMPYSWNEMLFDYGKWGTGHNAFFGYADGSNRNTLEKHVKPYEMADVPDDGYPDGLTANLAMAKMKELKKRDKPFFLGVGFFKPHLPFNAPKKYWDLYNEDSIPLAPYPNIPKNGSLQSLHESGEFNQYLLGDEKAGLDHSVSDRYARKLRHAYLASVSYVDAQIGKVLKTLEEEGLSDNTIVVLWGDHGWHLGDQRVWGKHTIFENALASPLMIHTPEGRPGKSTQIVSSIDVYPTLVEMAGISDGRKVDGESLVPLLQNGKSEKWRNTAYSYFRSGISLRTDRYRLSEYHRRDSLVYELYDHGNDPNETKNIADERPDLVTEMLPTLQLGDTGLYNEQQ